MPGVTAEQIAHAKAIGILEYVLAQELNNIVSRGSENQLKCHSTTRTIWNASALCVEPCNLKDIL